MKRNKILIGISLSIALLIAASSCKSGKEKETKTEAKDSVTTVLKPGSTIKLNPDKKYIFLTWDDGPQPPGTNNCERVFRDNNVKATFFMVGMNAFSPSRMRIVDTIRNSYPLFLLANHSNSHGFRDHYTTFYNSPDSAMQDFYTNEKLLQVPVKIVRFPGRNSWVENGKIQSPKSATEVCKRIGSAGYSAIGWDLEWHFKGSGSRTTPVQGAEEMANEVKNKFANYSTYAQNAVVILAHDRMFGQAQYADSLDKFIKILKQDTSYIFETIDHYPLIQKGK